MTGMAALPPEVIQAILSDQCLQLPDLFNCSLVCRSLADAASAELYRNVNLWNDERSDDEDEELSRPRQLRLLRSISENPKLGACVSMFKNHDYHEFGGFFDATFKEGEKSMLISAAKNMKHLSKASLTPNHLAAHIIATLPFYSQLSSLAVCGLRPQSHIWDMAPVNLTSLEWVSPSGKWSLNRDDYNPWDTAQFLINVAEATCPGLESLNISITSNGRQAHDLPTAQPEIIQKYSKKQAGTTILTKLRHFRFRHGNCRANMDGEFLAFIKRHQQSLRSVSIPVCSRDWNRGHLQFILNVCNQLPDLKELRLENGIYGRAGEPMTLSESLCELIKSLASPKYSIESFYLADIYCPFSPAIAEIFKPLENLKTLHLGDGDNADGPYGDDGRLNFNEYRSEIVDFIKALPVSLEQLYLEINGEGLSLDDDEDFDPMCDFGKEIFVSSRRLHTCDIHAWISNCDGGLGSLPEKAVLYRRLPHVDLESTVTNEAKSIQGTKIKDVWTSRMDCIYQEENTIVTAECEVVELAADEGEFEGEDAPEVWCDGLTSDDPEANGGDGSGHVWPFSTNKVASYPKFRKAFF